MLISNILTIILTLVIIIPVAFVLIQKEEEKPVNDPRRSLTPNDTNYNIGETIPLEVIQKASKREIMEIIDKAERGHISSLTRKDFYHLKERLESTK